MAYYQDGLPVATNAVEAAAWHKSVRVSCRCGRTVVFNGDGIWWLCERKGWPFDFVGLRRHFYCTACNFDRRGKVHPRAIEACEDLPETFLPHPPGDVARKAAKRFR